MLRVYDRLFILYHRNSSQPINCFNAVFHGGQLATSGSDGEQPGGGRASEGDSRQPGTDGASGSEGGRASEEEQPRTDGASGSEGGRASKGEQVELRTGGASGSGGKKKRGKS